MLVQDYDGLIRIAPAVPPGWDIDGSVYVRGRTKVDVQIRNGAITTAVIEAGTTQQLKVRNPWPGQPIDVRSGKTVVKVIPDVAGTTLTFPVVAGISYQIKRKNIPVTNPTFEAVSGTPSSSAKKLGSVQIGLFSKD